MVRRPIGPPVRSSRALVANASWIIGLVIVLGGVFIGKANQGTLSDKYLQVVAVLGLPWAILPCLLAVIYQEVPRNGMASIRGPWAVIQGIFGLLVFGGLEIYALYLLAH